MNFDQVEDFANKKDVLVCTGEGETENEAFTIGQRIVVDFNIGATAVGLEEQPIPRSAESRTMSTLLQDLMSNAFSRSLHVIEIAGQDDNVSANFFVNFADVTERHIGQYHGFWGMISEINSEGPSLLFSSCGNDGVSVYLDLRYYDEIYQRFNFATIDQETDVHMLVFGELKRAGSNDKKHVKITDPSRFTLNLAR